ncbi:MAG: glycosyltransferase [Candidatus Eisenbacteria bacterium]|nr:glycosyltransferase [Candidatus Eisenbacteria bacterium]
MKRSLDAGAHWTRADLHVHSRHGARGAEPSPLLGEAPCQTDPETVYRLAKRRGMDFVTITDRDRLDGALELVRSHPEDTFTGVEVTSRARNCRRRIRVLVYGLDQCQFREIERLRGDVVQLRNFLHREGLAHGTANPLDGGAHGDEALRQAMVLFNVLESSSGTRSRVESEGMERLLGAMTRERFQRLAAEQGAEDREIAPVGAAPWRKGEIAGSDDRAGLFIGRSWTAARASTPSQFLESVRRRETRIGGHRHNYAARTLAVYRMVLDLARGRSGRVGEPLLSWLGGLIFERENWSAIDRLLVRGLNVPIRFSPSTTYRRLAQLAEALGRCEGLELEAKLEQIHESCAAVIDELLGHFIESNVARAREGDLVSIVRSISASLPLAVGAAPFLTSLAGRVGSIAAVEGILEDWGVESVPGRVLWFTDTFNELNGVAVTLEQLARLAKRDAHDVHVVTCLEPGSADRFPDHNLIELPQVFSFRLPHYDSYVMEVPALVQSLRVIDSYAPSKVVISTPGPIGLLGLLYARLTGTPCVGVYHTDYALQAEAITGDEELRRRLDGIERWFFGAVDEIEVPTREYMRILAGRGHDPARMHLMRRGVDADRFRPRPARRAESRAQFGLDDRPWLLYTGRISADKGLETLLDAYRALVRTSARCGLILAGSGPDAARYQAASSDLEGVRWTGKLSQQELAELYACVDLFVFPSATDTFGMSVLEAQVSGLPAIVTDKGGPREIVRAGETGWVRPAYAVAEWTTGIGSALDLIASDPERFREIGARARVRAMERFDWEVVIQDLLRRRIGGSTARPGRVIAGSAATEPGAQVPA